MNVIKKIKSTILDLVLPIFILAIQNGLIYRNHYTNQMGIPWDFVMSYYAVPAFWMTLIGQGLYPAWIPFQGMGYPFALNLQSGFYYLPFWIFPLLKIPYTFYAAQIFQIVHVFFGSIGVFLLFKLHFDKPVLALIGALAFQFFGGFYSNAEHADIIRAFCIIPWVLYASTWPTGQQYHFPSRLLLLPLWIYLLATGGYPGNFVATLFILGIYNLTQFLNYKNGRLFKDALPPLLFFIVFLFLGLGLAFVYLAPAIIDSQYLVRSELNGMKYLGLSIQHLPGLFLSNDILPDEISMTSTYISIPVIVLVFFLKWKSLKNYWQILGILLIGILMIGGSSSFFWSLITSVLTVLKLSRFPSSDYRIFIAIPLIFLGVTALKDLISEKYSLTSLVVRFLCSFSFILSNSWFSYPGFFQNTHLEIYGVLFLITSSILIINQSQKTAVIWAGLLIISIICADAYRVLPRMLTWQSTEISRIYDEYGWKYKNDSGEMILNSLGAASPSSRPARIAPNPPGYTWAGYLTGNYLTDDLHDYYKYQVSIKANPDVYKYMKQPWTPIWVGTNYLANGKVSIPKEFLSAPPRVSSISVVQTYYSIREIYYEVDNQSEIMMVENEPYFPGWEAKLIGENFSQTIEAISVNDVLRGWILPAGRYRMQASFDYPNWNLYLFVSFGFSLMWVIISVITYLRQSGNKFN